MPSLANNESSEKRFATKNMLLSLQALYLSFGFSYTDNYNLKD